LRESSGREGPRLARAALALPALAALLPASALAIEFLEGRVQIHGYFEEQVRVVADDYSPADGYDLTQWYNVLDVESEWDVAPDGWGPFDLVSAFVRVEARYDCVWTGGCGILPLQQTYGDGAKRLPERLSDARKSGLVGALEPGPFADRRDWIRLPIKERSAVYGAPAGLGQSAPDQRHLARLWDVAGVGELLFAGRGPDLVFGTSDDPGLYVANGCNRARAFPPLDPADVPPGAVRPNDVPCEVRPLTAYLFALQRQPGPFNGSQTRVLGPWRPRERLPASDFLRTRANPLRPGDEQPVLGVVGQGQLPFRPAPLFGFEDRSAPRSAAQGLFLPNAAFQGLIGSDHFGFYDQNFTESELAWNHGASQRSEYELKEAYVDLELFEGRLWVRGGKQTIVWGKTEIFRAQDQWNPQDLGLASLPSLEESRTPLWSLRGVWSFYDVGPLEDVRLEVAANLDEFEPVDTGRCGEPYAPPAACQRAFGFFGYSIAGTGLAGEKRPAPFWEDPEGLEWGVRLEFREDRVSFALSYFRGHDDFPHVEPVFVFERNVDPQTGRPRAAGERRRCDPDGLAGPPDTSGCLGAFDAAGMPAFSLQNPAQVQDVLARHPANQQLFHVVCASTIAFDDILPEGCSLNLWNSTEFSLPGNPAAPRLSVAFTAMLAGGAGTTPPNALFNGRAILFSVGEFAEQGSTVIDEPADLPLVPLVADPGDGPSLSEADLLAAGLPPDPIWTTLWGTAGLAPFLSQAQEALLGCGSSEGPDPSQSFTRRSFWGTHCDITGFDVFNTEASAFFQSWPGFEGTEGVWLTNDASRAQPGTAGFAGGPVCTRFEGGTLQVLPGCTSGGGLVHPLTGQLFASEMAALSWNALMVFVTLSLPDDADGDGQADRPPPGDPYRFDEFDPLDPFRTDGCSYVNPSVCKNVASLLSLTAVQKRTVKAGGNGRFGRRDFQWAGGAAAILEYQEREVLGFALDFAEDRTKTSWGVEFTWFPDVLVADNDSFDALARVDLYNLVISVDRLTFVRFLNRSRSFFMNLQVFLQYAPQHRASFPREGPVNALTTLSVLTGYHQDRLVPSLTWVHDWPSHSGALLAGVSYRYTENLTIQIGANAFYGKVQSLEAALVAPGTAAGGAGRGAQRAYVENGLSQVRDRDELFLRLRYTF
jgi:hypothetical protein